jgi:hypothetical protein
VQALRFFYGHVIANPPLFIFAKTAVQFSTILSSEKSKKPQIKAQTLVLLHCIIFGMASTNSNLWNREAPPLLLSSY